MAKEIIVVDKTTGKRKAIAFPGFLDEPFTSGGQVFNLATDIDSDNWIDVWIDGGLQDPAAWTADYALNRITLSEAVASGRSVRVRIYLH